VSHTVEATHLAIAALADLEDARVHVSRALAVSWVSDQAPVYRAELEAMNRSLLWLEDTVDAVRLRLLALGSPVP